MRHGKSNRVYVGKIQNKSHRSDSVVSQPRLTADTSAWPGDVLFNLIKMDENGYFRIWRKIRFHAIWRDHKSLAVFLYCLNHAEWTSGRKLVVEGKEVTLSPGQFSCGRKQLSEEMGLSEQNVRTAFKKLEKTYEILTIKSTTKFCIVTILNWDRYQNGKEKSTNKLTNNQPTTNQRLTTQEEFKNLRIEEKKTYPQASPSKPKTQRLKKCYDEKCGQMIPEKDFSRHMVMHTQKLIKASL